ncbi:paramyosin, short form-like [Choristoneura fumiferana]|uniref:paramyosin, short form-like n=1 Tax=Choristoneura fumiferana TaxID=7141 RepID=UPI003D1571F4
MPPVKVPTYKWNRPPTAVYEDNYGYGINFYQPMIDYISAKEHGSTAKPPHLPWNNERGLEKYRFDKPVNAYSQDDLSRITHDISEQAKRDLNKFEVRKRAPVTMVAAAAAMNVTKHVGAESVNVKARKIKVNREKIKAERQKKRMDEIEKELELYEKQVNVGAELKGKAMMYRGKSAKAIAQTLLDESRRNVDQAHVRKMDTQARKDQIDRSLARVSRNIMSESHAASSSQKRVTECEETVRTYREMSPRTCVVRIKEEMPIIDDSYLRPLGELKETLKQFEHLNTSIMIDTR